MLYVVCLPFFCFSLITPISKGSNNPLQKGSLYNIDEWNMVLDLAILAQKCSKIGCFSGSQQTILLCIVVELKGVGSVAVTVGVSVLHMHLCNSYYIMDTSQCTPHIYSACCTFITSQCAQLKVD